MKKILIVGSYLSPYVRKVLVVLRQKNIQYEIDPIVTFFANEEFTKVSPLRTIPVLINNDMIVNDSKNIVQYLEECHPTPSVFPKIEALDADPGAARAKTRWIEEYSDSRLGQLLIWKLWNEKILKKVLHQAKADPEVISRTL